MTRRTFFLFTAQAAVAQGLADPTANSEIAATVEDTWIRLISDADPDVFFVAVRTSIQAEYVLVTVLYKARTSFGTLLRSKESMAPVAGIRGYGATRENFNIPRDKIDHVDLMFLSPVKERKVTK